MNNIRYHLYLGSTEDCKKKIMEATNRLVQRNVKGSTKYRFIFDSWFASKRLSESVMHVGSGIIDMVKINKKDSARISSRR